LGIDLRPADDFPQDDTGYGFDTIADVLSVSPVLMDRYLRAAERLARAAIFGPEPAPPTLERLRVRTAQPRPVREVPARHDAACLGVSPRLRAGYLRAAERLGRRAIFGREPAPPTLERLRVRTAHPRPVREVPARYDTSGLSLPNSLHATHLFPVEGQYLFRA